MTAPVSGQFGLSGCIARSIRASPMSRILTVPFLSSSRLAGLMSRCTTPSAWANSRPSGRLQDVIDGLLDRKRPVLLDQRREIAPLDVFHDEEVDAIGLVGIDRRRRCSDGRSLAAASTSRWKRAAAAAFFIMLGGSILIATMPLHPAMLGLEDLPHAPCPDLLQQDVVPQDQRLALAPARPLRPETSSASSAGPVHGPVLRRPSGMPWAGGSP